MKSSDSKPKSKLGLILMVIITIAIVVGIVLQLSGGSLAPEHSDASRFGMVGAN